ncbi:MAG: hypothetical protein K2Q12_04425 [Rickettsiales bacterium]|nr:hypothetical protein [Rickettsiales bacterium]
MKIIYTLGLIALIASASAAQANDNAYPLGQKPQRIHNQQEYWQGKPGNSASVQKSAEYDVAVTPQQRMAKRSAEYFAGKGGNSGATLTKNSDYDFVSTPQQRTAKRNYDYFNK